MVLAFDTELVRVDKVDLALQVQARPHYALDSSTSLLLTVFGTNLRKLESEILNRYGANFCSQRIHFTLTAIMG